MKPYPYHLSIMAENPLMIGPLCKRLYGVACEGVGAGKGRGRRKGGTGRGEWSQCCQMPDLGHLTLKPTSKLIIETHLPDHTIIRN